LWVTAFDHALADSQLVKSCREIAVSIIGKRHAWCRFDCAIYKHPGAGPVPWHQDIALSTTRISPRSVHFWIPLNDHEADSGCMAYLPGSHQIGVVKHRPTEGLEGTRLEADQICGDGAVSIPLSVGNFSIHSPMTLHRSYSNCGKTIRKALTLEFSPGPWSAARQLGRPLLRAGR
jgi:ectoine hydroxylase-related dioxygenase (phytanoyl-CoA dioxygenase family)